MMAVIASAVTAAVIVATMVVTSIAVFRTRVGNIGINRIARRGHRAIGRSAVDAHGLQPLQRGERVLQPQCGS